MSIDSIGSNDDFYNDETGIQGLKTFDADEIVWRGRKVSETLDNRGIHSILKTSLNSRQAVSSGKEKKYESGSFALPFDGYSPHFHYVPGPTPGSRAYTPPPFVPPPVPLHINNPPPPPINFPPPVFVPPPMPQIHYKPPVLVAPTPSPLSNLPPQIVIPSTQITPPSPSPASLPSFESINLLQSTPATLPLSLPTIEALIPLEKTVIASHVLSNPSSTMQDIAKPPKEMALENVPLSLLEGLKHGVVDSVTELPTTISNVVKQGGGYLIDQFVHPLDHILPGQELIAQGFAAKEAISYLRTHDKGALFQILTPEAHKLVTEWDNLSAAERTNLGAYCVGKYGTDFLLPGVAAKSAKIVIDLAKVEIAVGTVLKEALEAGKIENAIAASTKEAAAVDTVADSSKLAKGGAPLANPEIARNFTAIEKELFTSALEGKTIIGTELKLETLLQAGLEPDRAGLTRAGRALMKHGNREGSVFPKPSGNADALNERGQKVLEMILHHPEKQILHAEFERYGKIIDIQAPGIGGARYSADGKFFGFLEPEVK